MWTAGVTPQCRRSTAEEQRSRRCRRRRGARQTPAKSNPKSRCRREVSMAKPKSRARQGENAVSHANGADDDKEEVERWAAGGGGRGVRAAYRYFARGAVARRSSHEVEDEGKGRWR